MSRKLVSLASAAMVLGLLTTASYGQLLGVYRFDGGGDGTSWDDANNWEQVTDPFGGPISGNPATPPDPVTSAHIPLAGVVIDNTMPGQTALDVLIGTTAGAGSLNMTGGDLTARDFNVGADGPGSSPVSGSVAARCAVRSRTPATKTCTWSSVRSQRSDSMKRSGSTACSCHSTRLRSQAS